MNGMQVSHYLNYIISLFTCIHSTNIVLSTGQERLILPRGWQAPADRPAVRRRSVYRMWVFRSGVVGSKILLTVRRHSVYRKSVFCFGLVSGKILLTGLSCIVVLSTVRKCLILTSWVARSC